MLSRTHCQPATTSHPSCHSISRRRRLRTDLSRPQPTRTSHCAKLIDRFLSRPPALPETIIEDNISSNNTPKNGNSSPLPRRPPPLRSTSHPGPLNRSPPRPPPTPAPPRAPRRPVLLAAQLARHQQGRGRVGGLAGPGGDQAALGWESRRYDAMRCTHFKAGADAMV